jgi:hypothetical protein
MASRHADPIGHPSPSSSAVRTLVVAFLLATTSLGCNGLPYDEPRDDEPRDARWACPEAARDCGLFCASSAPCLEACHEGFRACLDANPLPPPRLDHGSHVEVAESVAEFTASCRSRQFKTACLKECGPDALNLL